ncbi:MAG: hypothetical protein M0Q90_08275 [Bacteroidales bacterium]|nr:hypothetical protein [Bacteroidales bacterium]
MLMNIVTDDELLTSQIIKTILLVIIVLGIIYNFFRIIRVETKGKKFINLILLIFLFVAIFFVFKQYRVEAALLKNPEYLSGTTIGYCNAFAKGQGVEFEYEINGHKYLNCDTFYPVSKDSILVPGGEYLVRYSKEFPDKGRMDFQKPVR